MLEYQTIDKKVRVPMTITCDKCSRSYEYGGSDEFLIQEFHQIRFTGGYNSVFGDGVIVEADVCQDCLKEIIGSWCKTYNDPFNNQEFIPHDHEDSVEGENE